MEKRQIIIADETKLFRHGLRVLLDGAGYDVVAEAATGAEALAMAAEHPGCVMLLDLESQGQTASP